MKRKKYMDTFLADIDRITSGESISLNSRTDCDREYREMLAVAQLLGKIDFSQETQRASAKLWDKLNRTDELDNEDLDMVAGGLNPDALNEDPLKKRS